jgi:hypothetical protein
MFRSLAMFLLGPLVFSAVATAQKPDEKGISIRLFAVAANPNQGKVCFLIAGKRGEAFELPIYNLSDPQSVSAREIQLILSSAPTDVPPRPVSTIRLPDTGRDFRVILVPAAADSYQAVVVRGDDQAFRNGDAFFINLSSHHILGIIGTTKLDLKSGARETIRPTGASDGSFYQVKFARKENEQLLPVADTRWPVLRNNRSFLIFFNGKDGLPNYRAVDEFLDPGAVP